MNDQIKSKAEVSFISYPKSGRTWMNYAIHLMRDSPGNQPPLVKFTHAGHGGGRREMGKPFAGVDKQYLRAKNIFMYRNALDTAVSMYFQIHKKNFRKWGQQYLRKYLTLKLLRTLPPKDIQKFVLDPDWGIETICRFNRAWLDTFDSLEDRLIISYEEAKNDPATVLKSLADYLEITPVIPLSEVVEKSTFDSMKKMELSNPDTSVIRLHGNKNNDQEAMKVRRGVVKGYTKYLDDDTIKAAQAIADKYGFKV